MGSDTMENMQLKTLVLDPQAAMPQNSQQCLMLNL